MSRKFRVAAVLVEDRVPRLSFVRRRIRRLGPIDVAGQLLFQMVARPLLRAASRRRISEILEVYGLDASPLPRDRVTRVVSVNSAQTIATLRELAPRIVLVSGTRVLSRNLLASVPAPFLNVHSGITPLYRGVHGAYWALVMGDAANCGATIHLVDSGIDTGLVLAQVTIQPTTSDNIMTYHLLQLAAAAPMLIGTLGALLQGDLAGKPPPVGASRLWSHPTLWSYVWHRLTRGVR